jgi:hypothetical protein
MLTVQNSGSTAGSELRTIRRNVDVKGGEAKDLPLNAADVETASLMRTFFPAGREA